MTTTAETFKYALPDNEALLRAWLRLSTCINNSRIVSAM